MEQPISLEQVQHAIKQLQEQGERVSRRNVRAITGGGMSTVHRLMGILEEQEALQGSVSTEGISETFGNALRLEIAMHVKVATESHQQQVSLLKAREQEALEALETSETKADLLEKQISSLKELLSKERQEADKSQAVARESIRRLETWVGNSKDELRELNDTIDTVRSENIALKIQVDSLSEAMIKAEKSVDRLALDLGKTQKALAEAEKKAAVSQQKAADLKDVLLRMERGSRAKA